MYLRTLANMFIPTIVKDYLNRQCTRKDLSDWLITTDYSYDDVLSNFLDIVTLLCSEESDESYFRLQLFTLIEEYNEQLRKM